MDSEASDNDTEVSEAESRNSGPSSRAFSPGDTERQASSSSSGSDVSRSTASTVSRRARGERETSSSRKKKRKYKPSLYDFVAGAVKKDRVRPHHGHFYTRPWSAADFYFQRKRHKTGDEDEDSRLYWHREVEYYELPSSEVLWGVMQYASHFFEDKGGQYLNFMDESALLAMGILLEETMKESLGEKGFLAFLEPKEDSEVEDEEEDDDDDGNGERENVFAGDDLLDRIFRETVAEQTTRLANTSKNDKPSKDKSSKKRKLTADEDEDEDDDVDQGWTRDDFLTTDDEVEEGGKAGAS